MPSSGLLRLCGGVEGVTHMTCKALQVIRIAQGPHELPGQVLLTLPTYPLLPARPSAHRSLPLSLTLLAGAVSIQLPVCRGIMPLSHCELCLPIRGGRGVVVRLVVVEGCSACARRSVVRGDTHHQRASSLAHAAAVVYSIAPAAVVDARRGRRWGLVCASATLSQARERSALSILAAVPGCSQRVVRGRRITTKLLPRDVHAFNEMCCNPSPFSTLQPRNYGQMRQTSCNVAGGFRRDRCAAICARGGQLEPW